MGCTQPVEAMEAGESVARHISILREGESVVVVAMKPPAALVVEAKVAAVTEVAVAVATAVAKVAELRVVAVATTQAAIPKTQLESVQPTAK